MPGVVPTVPPGDVAPAAPPVVWPKHIGAAATSAAAALAINFCLNIIARPPV
jgi:hypothetical protein